MGKESLEYIKEVLENKDIELYIKRLMNDQFKEFLQIIQYEEKKHNDGLKNENERLNEKILELTKAQKILQQENGSLCKKIEEKENELRTTQDSVFELQERLKEEEKKYSELDTKTEEYEREIVLLKEKNKEYETAFGELDTAYYQYKSLSYDTKLCLKNIFFKENEVSFLASGLQWDSINALWEFIKLKVVENDAKDLELLISILETLFNVFSQGSGGTNYQWIVPEIGERFDCDKHFIRGTKTDGNISRVLLKGYANSKTGKIGRKAIVEV